MRLLVAALLAAFAVAAAAQTAPRPRPPGTVPLEEPPPPPPPPPVTEGQPELQPQPEVTTRTEGDNQVQEYRIRGKLYMVRVTPRHGRPYVLIDNQGTGTFVRQDNPLDTGLRVPQWVLMEF